MRAADALLSLASSLIVVLRYRLSYCVMLSMAEHSYPSFVRCSTVRSFLPDGILPVPPYVATAVHGGRLVYV